MKYSKNQKLAKDFLRWLHQTENYEKWFEVNEGYSVGATTMWEEHAMWAQGRQAPPGLPAGRAPGRGCSGTPARPPARPPRCYSKYIIVDMYAKAVQGMKAEDAVKWAEGELKKIYEA